MFISDDELKKLAEELGVQVPRRFSALISVPTGESLNFVEGPGNTWDEVFPAQSIGPLLSALIKRLKEAEK
jgi:hypothetical protein